MKTILLAHVFATLGMVAVIWFVQLVHYPLFEEVGQAGFRSYAEGHQRRISWIVIPLMLVELGTAGLLMMDAVGFAPSWERWLGLGLVVLIWAATFLLSVPEHGRLAQGFDQASIGRLVATNWIRTLAWSVRGGLVCLWLARVVRL